MLQDGFYRRQFGQRDMLLLLRVGLMLLMAGLGRSAAACGAGGLEESDDGGWLPMLRSCWEKNNESEGTS